MQYLLYPPTLLPSSLSRDSRCSQRPAATSSDQEERIRERARESERARERERKRECERECVRERERALTDTYLMMMVI